MVLTGPYIIVAALMRPYIIMQTEYIKHYHDPFEHLDQKWQAVTTVARIQKFVNEGIYPNKLFP